MSTPENPNISSKDEDFRAKQIYELEQLQKILDSNNNLRAKYNSLQTQVAPLVDQFSQQPNLNTTQNERTYSPEEINLMRQKLEQTLLEYREETRQAGLISSDIGRRYTELSTLKMHFRKDQDEKLTHQNGVSAIGEANFEAKSKRVHDAWAAEKQRLLKSIGYLQKIFEQSSSDIKEFEVQTNSNNRGIMHLSTSITIAKEDIRDFSEQLSKLEPKMQEYEALAEKHKASEVVLVGLSDELENLKKQVDTESLTANVRRQIEAGQQSISDLNIQIDKVQLQTAQIQEKAKETTKSIQSLQSKIEKIRSETKELKNSRNEMEQEKKKLIASINDIRTVRETKGGGNAELEKQLQAGITLTGEKPWRIRKQILSIKGDVKEMDRIVKDEAVVEQKLKNVTFERTVAPPRKRIPLIPLQNH